MAKVPGKGYLLFVRKMFDIGSVFFYLCEYLGTLRIPGLEKIVDRSPVKPIIIKEGD
jgi:hypothetical protein